MAKKQINKEDKETFLEWYEKLGGKSKLFIPKDLDGWFDAVEKSHKDIRELFGGVHKTATVEYIDDSMKIANYYTCAPYITVIIRLLPCYTSTYNLSYYDDLLYCKLLAHKNISTAKHIMGYAERMKISDEAKKELEIALSNLGKIWHKPTNSKITATYTITTSPRAFAKIGHYGMDNSSCFTNGHMNNDKKFALAIVPNSFVLIQHKEKSDVDNPEDDNTNISSRLIGNATTGLKRINLSNAYGGTVKTGSFIEEVIKDIFGFKSVTKDLNKFKYTCGMNYINAPVISILESDKNISIPMEEIEVTDIYSKEYKPNGDEYADWKKVK
jgi:hypothetical protein